MFTQNEMLTNLICYYYYLLNKIKIIVKLVKMECLFEHCGIYMTDNNGTAITLSCNSTPRGDRIAKVNYAHL